MQLFKTLIPVLILASAAAVHADNFEIIDGTATVTGKPSYSPQQARDNWDSACEQWKNETKDFNKTDQIMMLSCQTPVCGSNEGNETTCSSTAIMKIKTAGTRVQHRTKSGLLQDEISCPYWRMLARACEDAAEIAPILLRWCARRGAPCSPLLLRRRWSCGNWPWNHLLSWAD